MRRSALIKVLFLLPILLLLACGGGTGGGGKSVVNTRELDDLSARAVNLDRGNTIAFALNGHARLEHVQQHLPQTSQNTDHRLSLPKFFYSTACSPAA